MDPAMHSDSLIRLETLRQVDAGLYIVAVHAFIETWAAGEVEFGSNPSFHELMPYCFQNRSTIFPDYDSQEDENLKTLLDTVVRDYRLSGLVRHRFARISGEEARGVTWTFLRLGDYTGWSASPAAGPLRQSLEIWEQRGSASGDSHLVNLKEQFRGLRSRLAENESPESAPGDSGGIDPADSGRYIEGLFRFVHIARTRRDYEKHRLRLAPEQQEALSGFSTDQDMLITGGAGTGKTLVLLEALARTLGDHSPELDMVQSGRTGEQKTLFSSSPARTTLVTFTRTLVKYDRYLTGLMAPGRLQEADLLSSETFFWKKLAVREPKHKVDYKLLRNMMAEVNDTGVLSDAELWIEIEEFLFGLNISREEYLDAAVPRRGLKTPLNLKEREKVWDIRDALVEDMIFRGIYSKHFARIRLLDHLAENPDGLITHEHLFVDESQDMSAAELMCLKALAGRSLIMAGDTGQSIYGFINPYRRANLELSQEQLRLLRTNHRNTIPIHTMAEAYRRVGLNPGEDPGPESFPFREGPDPEIHQLDDPDALADLLAAKAQMYVDDLGYRPESVGVLCSRTAHLEIIAGKLAEVGLESAVIKGADFEFSGAGTVRLSTLHSSKGLDFPVVLMYLPELPPAREIDPPYQDRLYRNLQYVAMSRGMDVVEIFEKNR